MIISRSRYDTSYDILEAFYARRLPVYEKRREYMIGKITEDIVVLYDRIKFVTAVVDKVINVVGTKKTLIREKLEALGIPYEIYTASRTSNLSEDDIADLKEKILSKENERLALERTTAVEMWLSDLDDLEKVYRSTYGFKKEKGPAVIPGSDGFGVHLDMIQ